MTRATSKQQQQGFTLIELITALGIFLVICGAAFTLLGASQKHYQSESQVLTSFQEARLGLDQIVRDVNDAGFPPPTFTDGNPLHSASSPFAWSSGSGYAGAPCLIGTGGGGTCTTATDSSPGDFDVIVETIPNPQDPNCAPNCKVQWIRYELQATTLMRAMVDKVSGGDPDAATSGGLAPFVQNVINNSTATQIAQYQATYPGMFPAGNPVPIFSYTCDIPSAAQPQPCLLAGANNSPANIRDVLITLIVSAPTPDTTTGVPRIVQLSGRGRRVNPNK